MDLTEIESSIAKQLKPLERENLKIIVFPDNPEELTRPAINRLVVGFMRESLTEPQTFNAQARVQQVRNLEFQIYIQFKDLRAKKELRVTDLMDKIRDRLTLFRPDPNIQRWLYQVSGGYTELFQGFWLYSMTFVLPYPYTKHPEN